MEIYVITVKRFVKRIPMLSNKDRSNKVNLRTFLNISNQNFEYKDLGNGFRL